MMPIRTVLALAAVLLAGGLLAACGTDDKETYGQDVQDVLEPLASGLDTLGTEISAATTEAQLIDGLGSAETEITAATTELEALDVPDDVAEVNVDLIAAISGFGDQLAAIRKAAEAGDTAQLEELAAALPGVATYFQTELDAIEAGAIAAGVPIDDSSDEE